MADDGFDTYFAEKLWEMIPAVHRHEDGLGDNPGVLRSLVEVLAKQASIVRRSHDRLWEDQFIDLCEDWAVPYLGDLVGTRLVSVLNLRGRRVDVAKTIYYRRRKGTLAVLEELIGDITGWEGTVKENFRRLGRARHRLDPAASMPSGRFTGTPSGGWADFRSSRAAELTGGPFDEFHYTPDVRRHRGRDGRHNIPKLAFHIYRLKTYEISGVQPHLSQGDEHGFTFDPSGRDVPLFAPRGRPGVWESWRQAKEWELPGPIPCRVLGHAEYEINDSLILTLLDSVDAVTAPRAEALRGLRGLRYGDENRFRHALRTLSGDDLLEDAVYLPLAAGALVEECGKHALIPDAMAVMADGDLPVPTESVAAGDLSTWQNPPEGKLLLIDPWRGRFTYSGELADQALAVRYRYGFADSIGAGTYARPGVENRAPDLALSGGGTIPTLDGSSLDRPYTVQIDDSATYGSINNQSSIEDLTVQAANRERPYLCLQDDLTLHAAESGDAALILDGLWIGTQAETSRSIFLDGDWERVSLRHMTVDPGGPRQDDSPGDILASVHLVILGHVEQLSIESSITGPIYTLDEGVVEELVIQDSILQSQDPTVEALSFSAGVVTLQRVTVLGALSVHRLWASETLIDGAAQVFDTQNGCFRFSAAAEAGSRLPRPYEPYWLAAETKLFISRRFGNPGFCQLGEAAPEGLKRGAENGSEIGAFCRLLNPIKMDSLRAKVNEFMPFGLIPLFIHQT